MPVEGSSSKSNDDGSGDKKFAMPLLPVLIDTHVKLLKLWVREGEKNESKAFCESVNFNHLMPTRYSVDFELKKEVDDNALATENREKGKIKTISRKQNTNCQDRRKLPEFNIFSPSSDSKCSYGEFALSCFVWGDVASFSVHILAQ